MAETTVVSRFSKICRSHGTREALVWEAGRLTYEELDRQANRLSRVLIDAGVTRGDIVGVCFGREPEWVISLLAVLKAGAAYLPIAVSDPIERRAAVLGDSAAAFVLSGRRSGAVPQGIPNIEFALDGEPSFSVSESVAHEHSGCDDRAYVMYTSGSTGHPKGVQISHKNILRLAVDSGVLDLDASTRMLSTGAPTFDACTFEIWGTLLNGGTVVLPSEETITDGRLMKDEIGRHRITTMWLTAPLFRLVTQTTPDAFDGLRELVVGGDVVDPTSARTALSRNPGLRLINGYGPTENTTFSTSHRITIEDCNAGQIPIGRPLLRSTAYVLDEGLRDVPFGEVGELYVGGDGVALGYLHSADATAEAFMPDPFAAAGSRMYRTGDLAVQRPDGELLFVGRRDDQIKIRGYRVELGDVESRLASLSCVDAAAASVAQVGLERQLVAYVVPASPAVTPSSVRDELAHVAPSYLIPALIILLDSIPLSTNGKIDRKALPNPAPSDLPMLVDGHVTPLEQVVLTALKEVAGVSPSELRDSFFDLGIDSLVAIRLAARLTSMTNRRVAARDVLANSSVHDLAEALSSRPLISDNSTSPGRLHSGADGVLGRFALTDQQRALFIEHFLAPSSTRYNVVLKLDLGRRVDAERLSQAWGATVARHGELRARFVMAETPWQVVDVYQSEAATLDVRDISSDIEPMVRAFDIEKGPLVRAFLLRGAEGDTLFIDAHHLVLDGQSLARVVDDIWQSYQGRSLPPVAQYEAYVSFQSRPEAEERRQTNARYWRRRASLLGVSASEVGQPTQSAALASDVFTFTIGERETSHLRGWAREHRVTMFEALCLVYASTMCLITGQADILFASPVSGRPGPEWDQAVGLFVRTANLAVDGSCLEDAEDVREAIRGLRADLDHQETAVEDVRKIMPAPQTMFAYQDLHALSADVLGTRMPLIPTHPGEAMYPLNLQLFDAGATLHAQWEHQTRTFSTTFMRQAADAFCDAARSLTRIAVVGSSSDSARLEFDLNC